MSPPYVAVVGPSAGVPEALEAAESVGRALAERGAVVVCGGMGGAMEAAPGVRPPERPRLKGSDPFGGRA